MTSADDPRAARPIRRPALRRARVAALRRAQVAALRGVQVAAERDPVARVAVDVALAHLDRPFDYLVPAALAADARPGSRVRVRFAGQLVDGFVLERMAASEHAGKLSFIERSVSAEVVLAPEVLECARAVARHWAGTLADVLRLAVPPRHGAAERELPAPAAAAVVADCSDAGADVRDAGADVRDADVDVRDAAGWARYRSGNELLGALRDGRAPRAVWTALPGGDWPAQIAALAAATVAGGRGVLVVVPDRRDVELVDAALTSRLGAHRHVALTADVGPAARYRRFLQVSRGQVRVVVGTRAAAFAPVHDLGLVVVWDDGDDLHAEPRAPYPHARDVLVTRAHLARCAAVVGGHAMTAEGARLVASGWARAVAAPRAAVRAMAPLTRVDDGRAATGSPSPGRARLPSIGWQAARSALDAGHPVLVQVPRAGYLPALACANCRAGARCAHCHGPIFVDAALRRACRWCARPATGWRCPQCGGGAIRAVAVGAGRTAEELGKVFPGVVVRTSSHGRVLARVAATPALVVATPGAEPVAAGGYGAVLLLDGWALLARADLRAGEEAVRRWLNAAALARSAGDGGQVVLVADPGLRPVQAVVRWDPAGYAERELAERAQLQLPPAAAFAEICGDGDAVADLLAASGLPADVEVLGPIAADGGQRSSAADGGQQRVLLRAPRARAGELSDALRVAQGVRSARKAGGGARVRIDPVDVG